MRYIKGGLVDPSLVVEEAKIRQMESLERHELEVMVAKIKIEILILQLLH